ncbi:MAG: TolC family protein [Pseudomonadota bacterium]|nr:TolC family protein [Pseudomonadota bacterium]
MINAKYLLLMTAIVMGMGGMWPRDALCEEQIRPKVMNLEQIVALAVARSPEIEEARSDVEAARSDLRQAEAAYYPQIETIAVAGPMRDAKEPLVVNGRITDPSPGLSFSSIGIFGKIDITATQPLYTFGKIANRKEAAARGVKAREHAVADKRGQIVLRVKQLYYGLVLATSGLGAADESIDFFAAAAQRVRKLLDLESPTVRESDLYQVEAYRSEATRFRSEAEKGMRTAYLALKAMLGMGPGEEFAAADKGLPLSPEGLPDLADFIRDARANRPEFKQLAEALAAREFLVKGAESDLYPSFFAAAVGSLAGAPGRDRLNSPYLSDEFNHAYGGVVAGAKWNLDFGIGRAKVDKARAEYRRLINTKAAAEMNIPIQVTKVYQDCREALVSVNSYRDAAAASRKWTVAAMADFDMGIGSADNMLRAIDMYGRNQGKFIEALYRYNLSRAELDYVTGKKTW